MKTIKIDFNKKLGSIKQMNCVNNGPVPSNLELFKALKIPYARTHDTALYSGYGCDCIDVGRIFANFDADVNDEKNYNFSETDIFIARCFEAGAEPFYRLGASIEHRVKKLTIPPKDFLKWAKICEHIIRHYTEGWANGFNYHIEYWEIWNEPDLKTNPSPTWQGTFEQFVELYTVTATHLKKCFPNLKIGGPACAGRLDFTENFLNAIKGVPLDFYSYHGYESKIENIIWRENAFKETLTKCGYGNTELIYNEWNYIAGWSGDIWKESLEIERNYKGASFATAVMCISQNLPVDKIMYYDARPCAMNGIFSLLDPSKVLKTYYAFLYFASIYERQNQALFEIKDNNIIGLSSTNEIGSSILFTYYNNNEKIKPKDYKLSIKGMNKGKKKITIRKTSKTDDNIKLFEFTITGKAADIVLPCNLYDIYFVNIENI